MVDGFARRGWVRLGPDPSIAAWAKAARPVAEAATRDPALRARWLDCEGTWFVGVDVLRNDAAGRVGQGPALPAILRDALARLTGPVPPLHPAQVSAVWPGYPRPRAGDSAAAFRYRQARDGAHLDGLLPEGADRRRHLREPHAFILGLPLTDATEDAAPLVAWEGSHEVMRRAFAARLGRLPPRDWGEQDVTDSYKAARAEVFETCRRVPLPGRPGEAVLLHRLMLHGIGPWRAPDGPPRIVAYFRPLLEDPACWLARP